MRVFIHSRPSRHHSEDTLIETSPSPGATWSLGHDLLLHAIDVCRLLSSVHYADDSDGVDQSLLWVFALLDSLEACLHEGVVDCFTSPALLTHPQPPSSDALPSFKKIDSSGVSSPTSSSNDLSALQSVDSETLEEDEGLGDCRELCATHEASLQKLTEALHSVKAKKESLFAMRPEDMQLDYVHDPYAYDDTLAYEYNIGGEYDQQVSDTDPQGGGGEYKAEELERLTEDERQLYEWQRQQRHENADGWENGSSYWDDASDWVRYYDEPSERYFYFSETLQESRWEE